MFISYTHIILNFNLFLTCRHTLLIHGKLSHLFSPMSYNFPPFCDFSLHSVVVQCYHAEFFFKFSIKESFGPFFSDFWNFYFQKEFTHHEVIKYSSMIPPCTFIISYFMWKSLVQLEFFSEVWMQLFFTEQR